MREAFKLDPLNDDLKDKMNKAQKQEQKAIENGLFKFKSNASSSSVKASSVGAKRDERDWRSEEGERIESTATRRRRKRARRKTMVAF